MKQKRSAAMVGHDPSIVLLVARWGQWPPWTPLLLRTFAGNPTIAFRLLSDVAPAAVLPANIHHVPLTLPQLLVRLRTAVKSTLNSLTASGTYGSGVSSAKTNDFKPMFGVVFADLLRGFDWWGTLQEDLLVGDLRAFATNHLLAHSDVVCPFLPPLNASGVLMLYRNEPRINTVWQQSADVQRVLSNPAYQVFDEWWGPLERRDNFARVLGRLAGRGDIRLSLSSVRRKWMADDKRYGQPVSTNNEFVACWSNGMLWGNAQGAAHPCTNDAWDAMLIPASMHSRNNLTRRAGAVGDTYGSDVAVVHFSRLKREGTLKGLELDSVRHAIMEAHSFALTRRGVWLPEAVCEDDVTWSNQYGLTCAGYEAEAHCIGGSLAPGHAWAGGVNFKWPERACCVCGGGMSRRQRSSRHASGNGTRRSRAVAAQSAGRWLLWASGLLPGATKKVRVSSDRVTRHLRALEARDTAARCNITSRQQARKGSQGRSHDCTKLNEAAIAVIADAAAPCVTATSQAAADALGAPLC